MVYKYEESQNVSRGINKWSYISAYTSKISL